MFKLLTKLQLSSIAEKLTHLDYIVKNYILNPAVYLPNSESPPNIISSCYCDNKLT